MALDRTKGVLIALVVVLSILCIMLIVKIGTISAARQSDAEKTVRLEGELAGMNPKLENLDAQRANLESRLEEARLNLEEALATTGILKDQLKETNQIKDQLETQLREAMEAKELLERRLKAAGI